MVFLFFRQEFGDSPWSFWTKSPSEVFFDDDLLDVGFRVKNNNLAAMAQGQKLLCMSNQSSDRNLKHHFSGL
jgi:hypothetical protein